MKQLKIYIIVFLLALFAISSVALATRLSHFSWNILQNIENGIFHKQVAIECADAKDCQDIYKNCYYSCSSSKCVQIETFIALKPYPDCSSVVSCVPKWQCGWGPCIIPPCVPPGNSPACTNGSQVQVVIDSNNCGLPVATAEIACPALARICSSSASPIKEVTRKVGDKEFNFLIQKINTNSVDGLLYILYPVAMAQGQPKTLHIGDTVGYACEGKTAILSAIDLVNQTATFSETIRSAPLGGCPI